MARIFQDAAGTIPVTTFDQPVGKIVRGAGTVDLVQSDPGKRPTMKLFEPGGADPRWYLYCPAGTGLEAVVDAGEYEVASLDPWGGVAYETVTSDGSTPISFTRSTMSMDILFRTPIFSEGEKVAIEQYWSKWKVTPTVDDLYAAGQRGVFLDFSDQSTLFQTDDQTTPVTDVNDPIGLALDLSGNGVNMVQPVQTARGQYKTDGTARVQLDKVDDNYEFDFTGSGGFEATWYQPSKEGLVKGKLLIPDGVWKLAREAPSLFPSDNIMGLIIVEGDVSPAMEKAIFDWWEAKGCGMDFSTLSSTILSTQSFVSRADIASLDMSHWNISGAVTLDFMGYAQNMIEVWMPPSLVVGTIPAGGGWRNSADLRRINFNGLDFSQVVSMGHGFRNTSLKYADSFNPIDVFKAIPPGKSLSTTFRSISFEVDAIDLLLTTLADGVWANGDLVIDAGSAPSSIGEAAIVTLRSRGCTITVPGGF